MPKFLDVAILIIFTTSSLFAQKTVNDFVVTGKIIEKQSQQPLEYATIAFFSNLKIKLLAVEFPIQKEILVFLFQKVFMIFLSTIFHLKRLQN